jgi:signal transduction histidine kinase
MLKILIVEDNISFASAIELMLRRKYRGVGPVLVANSLDAALKQLTAKDIGVVLLDLTLPDSSGLGTLLSVSRQTKAPIVVLTAQDDESLAMDALSNGAQDYLLKGDITHSQLARAINYAIERQKSQELAAEKIRLFEQREDFIATLTHDLKNPLIGSNRILTLMTDGTLGKLPAQHVRLLLNLKDSNDALIAMIRNLLEVYKFDKDFEVLQKETTDLRGLVQAYIETIQPILDDKRIQLTVDCQNIGEILAERNSMMRVIQNLVENAIKFTPSGGQILINLWYEHPKAYFQVTDSGPGVPDEERSRLFQRFYQGRRGKASVAGTGLGLYLCRQIIEAHEGTIWCENYQENAGATFTLTLPNPAQSCA